MKPLNIYTVKIKGEDWQVVAIAENTRRAKLIGYKAIHDIDPQGDARYVDIRVKLLFRDYQECAEKVMTSCEHQAVFCKLWCYDLEMCKV